MASAMSDQRLTQYIGDGMQFMEKHKNEFDIVITDSSDPHGKSSVFYSLFLYGLSCVS